MFFYHCPPGHGELLVGVRGSDGDDLFVTGDFYRLERDESDGGFASRSLAIVNA
jgi:hypothetical protein